MRFNNTTAGMAKTSRVLVAVITMALAQSVAAQPAPKANEPAPKPTAEARETAGDATAETSSTTAAEKDVPVQLRIRSLEQRVQALKERAWRAKARVGMLKEQVLGGGVGAQAGITHVNDMGSKFRLIKLVYALDGQVVFSQEDENLYKKKSIEITSGPITPGSHTLSVLVKYRGHGYGVFRYMRNNYYTVKGSHTFTVEEGKAVSLHAIAFEKGGFGTQMRDRPQMKFKLSTITDDKPKPAKSTR